MMILIIKQKWLIISDGDFSMPPMTKEKNTAEKMP